MSSELGACPSCWCLSGYIKEAAEHLRTGETHCRGCKKRRKALVRPAASLLEGSICQENMSPPGYKVFHRPALVHSYCSPHPGAPMTQAPTCTPTISAPNALPVCPHNHILPPFKAQPMCLHPGSSHIHLAPTHTHTYLGPTYPGDPISTVPRAQDALRVHKKVYYLLKSE